MERERIKYLDLIAKAPYKIGHWLGFKDLTPLNNEWIRSFIFEKEDKTMLAHRGSYKTTCLAIAISLIMIIYPDINIIFLRKTDPDVIEVVALVAKILKSEIIAEIVKSLYGKELVLLKENASELQTNLSKSIKGASQLLGLGIKTSVTGKHADLVITDDIVNIKDRVSKAERELIKLMYQELQNVKNRGGRFINTGTPWHKEDAISLMPNVTRVDCYKSGLIDRKTLEEIRQSMTPSLFAANYELKHIADENALFSNPVFTDEEALIENGVCHIDAGYEGSDTTAFTIVKKTDNGFVTLGKVWDKHVDDCISEILALKRHYKAGTTWCEKNADKGYLAKELQGKGDSVKTYHESTNKYIKISTYLRKNWKDIQFLESTDPEYISQILDYNENAEYDDCADSLASIIRQIMGKQVKAKLYRGGI